MMFEKMDKQSRAIEKEKEQKENKNNKNKSPKPITPQKITNKLDTIASSQIFSDDSSSKSLS